MGFRTTLVEGWLGRRRGRTELGRHRLRWSRPKPFKLPHFSSFMAATNVAG